MSIFQIISTLFALFMLYVVTIHGRRAMLSAVEFTMWYSLWILFILLALFPNLLQGITGALNFARVFDLLIVGAFMILAVVVFLSYFTQKKNTRKLEEFIRSQAISRAAQKK